MKSLLLIIIPLAAAVLATLWPNGKTRPWLLPIVGVLHTLLSCWLFFDPPEVAPNAWLGFDPLARAVLPVVSVLFLVCACYGVTYLQVRAERPNRVFIAALLAVLGLLSAGHQARSLGLLWIFTEGVTLAAVPLLHFNGTPRAFEATWKYLLVGGTGIALSLLGSFCLGYASLHGGGKGDLTFVALIQQGPELSRPWVLIGWVLLLVGYGTKMGLAPMHTWKPEVYGEAPGIVGAILAGGVTSVAFTAILRVRAVVGAAGEGAIADQTMLAIGLFSMLVAALFLLGTPNFKRMLAYSSVEHMGILMVGAALGRGGMIAALFHVWSNGLTKGALFLSAANLRRAAGSAAMSEVRGMAAITPRSAAIFVTGMFAVTACPPFGPFFSELQVVRAALETGHGWAVAMFLACLLLAFFGLTRVVFGIVDGRPRTATKAVGKRFVETAGVILPPLVLLAMSLWLGLFAPASLRAAWTAAADQLQPATNPAWQPLFDGKTLAGWKAANFDGTSTITVTDGELRMSRGEAFTGIVRDGEPPARMNYEIELEAMRTAGHDFFWGLTFPVNQDPCTLMCGGWGGNLVGLSSIDDLDASENQTGAIKKFKDNTWYKIRLRVTTTHLTVWIDNEEIISQELTGRKISIRNEVEPCVPLGIATWETGAAFRNLRFRNLNPSEQE
jgi:hydrogenase-4 component F